jgi:antitoxin HigA-1
MTPPRSAASGPAKPDPRRPLDANAAGVRRRAPMHPGRFLARHYLTPLAMTQTEAARRLGVSRRRVNELVQAKRAMSPDTAIRCALAFGLPTADWLAMQAAWDSFQAWKTLRRAQRAGV